MKLYIMNGAGNRFVIFDARLSPDFSLTEAQIMKISEPGGALVGPKGADQVIVMQPAQNPAADLFMQIYNRDGRVAGACGNATRCVAWLALRGSGQNTLTIETLAGLLSCTPVGEYDISVDMGQPKLEWDEIPLAEYMDTRVIDVKVGPIDNPVLARPGAVNMGNPHCVFFVEDFDKAKPEKVGPMIEFHPLFPEQVNVGFARVDGPDQIRLKVWERGAGLTQACGTGACAAVVAAVRQSRTDRHVSVTVDGGVLDILWRAEDDHVIMTGPTELEYSGDAPADIMA